MKLAAARAWLIPLVASALLVGFSVHAEQKVEKDIGKHFDYAEIEKAPEKARAKRNPYEGKDEALAAGRNLFEQHCAECHGDDALGGKKAPSLRVDEVQGAQPGAIFW